MKKLVSLLLAAVMILSFAACSDNGGAVKADVTPAEIEAAIAAALGDGYLATETVPEDELPSSPIGALDLAKLKSYVVKQSTVPALNLDQVAIVECEEGYADEAAAAFNESLAHSVGYIRQYPFGVAKVEGARIYKAGNIVIYVIAGASPSSDVSAEEEAKFAFGEYEKIDKAIKDVLGTLPENLAVIPEDSGSGRQGGLIGG